MTYKEMLLNGKMPENIEVYDAHTHLEVFKGTVSRNNNRDGLIKSMEYIDAKISIASSTSAIIGDFKTGNDFLINECRKSNGKILGYVYVNPNYDDGTVEEIKRCECNEIVGVKIHVSYCELPITSKKFEKMFEYGDDKGLVFLSHTWTLKDACDVEIIAKRYPNIKIIAAHSGTNNGMEKIAELIKNNDNIYCDIATSIPRNGILEYLVENGDDGKILFGTDCLLFDSRITYGRIMLSNISDESKRKIMGQNFKNLFNINYNHR